MAQVDDGLERILQGVPGGEIWITEWNSRGADPETHRGADAEPACPGDGDATGHARGARSPAPFLIHCLAVLYVRF